jgi:hypothetical protein
MCADPTPGSWIRLATFQTMDDGLVLPTWGVQVGATGQWVGKVHPVGHNPECKAEAHANAGLFAASKSMAALLTVAVEAWAGQFDGPEDEDLSISGADLIDWFAEWRLSARAALHEAGVP